MRYLSLCSGIEAASVAWAPLGWEPAAFAEIDPFPNAVLKHHYPDVPNLGDITKFKEWPDLGTIDLICGGTPCFPSHVVISTKRGFIPISQVRVGDEVLTHKNRWRHVLRTGSKVSPTVVLKGQGLSDGLHTTPDHPIYSRTTRRDWVGRDNGSWKKEFNNPEWTPASQMKDAFWASPSSWPVTCIPPVIATGNEREVLIGPEAMRMIGRWLGDGWLRFDGERRAYVMICSGKHEANQVADIIAAAGFHATQSEERTTTRFQIASKALAKWLREHFGTGAHGKFMPTWVMGLPDSHRRALLDGYIGADGCETANGWRISTVSRSLALGSTLLAHSLGMGASRRWISLDRQCVIEGREVNEEGFYQITLYSRSRSSTEIDMHRWGRVRAVEKAGEDVVYDLEVDEDHSYVADGIVVHNCQSFSIAGLRQGMDDPRGNLALVYLAIVNRYRPRWVIYENVPGLLSSNGGRDFGSFLGALAELGYGFAYRVLDAQYVRVDGFGRAVPQRRRRVFVVGYLGDWRRAAAVLSEPESVLGDSPPRRQAGQSVAAPAPNGFASSGDGFWRDGIGPLRAREQDSHENLIASTGEISHCLNAGGMGRIDYETETMISVAVALGQRTTDHPNGMKSESDFIVPVAFGGNNTSGPIDVATACQAHGGPHGRQNFGSETFVAVPPVSDPICANEEPTAFYMRAGTQSVSWEDGTSPTLKVGNEDGRNAAYQMAVVMPPVADPICANEARTYSHEGENNFRLHNCVPQAVDVIGFQSKLGSHGGNVHENVSPTMQVHDGGGTGAPAVAFKPSHFTRGKDGAPTDVVFGLSADADKGDQDQVVMAIQERAISENADNGPDGVGVRQDGAAYTLEARQVPQAVAFAQNQRDEVRLMDVDGALAAEPGMKQQTYVGQPPAVAFTCKDHGADASSGVSPTLRAMNETDGNANAGGQVAIQQGWAVRRLMPVECCRLQGFPDDYLDIIYRGKPAADGPKYKALGNSWAVNCARWIGRRIEMVEQIAAEIESEKV